MARQAYSWHETRGAPLTARRAWTLGWLSGTLNPKLGVFFLTLLPQFVQPGSDEPARLLGLAVVFGALGLAWLLLVVEIVVRTIDLWILADRLAGPGARESRRRAA